MSAYEHTLLSAAASGATSNPIAANAHSVVLVISATTWGDGAIKIQSLQNGTWTDLKDGEFTANDQVVLEAYPSMQIRATATGSTLTGGSVVVAPRPQQWS